eukprot:4945286-Prymnesium_polylepis.1
MSIVIKGTDEWNPLRPSVPKTDQGAARHFRPTSATVVRWDLGAPISHRTTVADSATIHHDHAQFSVAAPNPPA